MNTNIAQLKISRYYFCRLLVFNKKQMNKSVHKDVKTSLLHNYAFKKAR